MEATFPNHQTQHAHSSLGAIPWHCYAVAIAATCITIGILWDISWHITIGRDSFWTPAHMCIYLGGLAAGLCSGWLAIRTTFYGTPEERAISVGLWGLRAPIGAWVCIWGAGAMLTSAPFDDWWHNTYGLDVKILSPPHVVLAAGMHHIVVGALLLVLSQQNRAPAAHRKAGGFLFVYAAGVMIALASVILTEFSFPNHQHSALYYQVSCALFPAVLVPVAIASRVRWPATIASGVYMLILMALIWILPLFPATPQLAPIYNPVTHMVPPVFPALLIVPGLAIDLIVRAVGSGRGFARDIVSVLCIATAFLTLFLATQWFFSIFLVSPAAENAFFAGNRYWSYGAEPGNWQREFWEASRDPVNSKALLIAFAIAIASTTIGLCWGNWMSKVRR